MTPRWTDASVPAAVLGAGPAGLTAAYALSREKTPVTIYELEREVGGLARTIEHKGFRFDIGGHRFFSASAEVCRLWEEILGPDLLTCRRQSRILYNRKLFDYPLRPWNTLKGLGLLESLRIFAGYAAARTARKRPEASFEDWVVNRFGRRLFETFFKAYTEKVWGIPCREIGAQWAAERIRGLSLGTVLAGMFRPGRYGGPRTLAESFRYPRLGPGMMWEAMRRRIEAEGGTIHTGTPVTGLLWEGKRIKTIRTERCGRPSFDAAGNVISSVPLRELILALEPAPPEEIAEAAGLLRYRDFITVALILNREEIFPDNWLYIHDPSVRLGRVQNFKRWSPEMVPDPRKSCLGLEYFCNEGDDLWSMEDPELISFAVREMESIGLPGAPEVEDGRVVRIRKAYPIYDENFPKAMGVLRRYLGSFENLQVVGRNGMHRYNNMDHAMLTALLAVMNLRGESHDLWAVDADDPATYRGAGEPD